MALGEPGAHSQLAGLNGQRLYNQSISQCLLNSDFLCISSLVKEIQQVSLNDENKTSIISDTDGFLKSCNRMALDVPEAV